jgi:hypothetical protein
VSSRRSQIVWARTTIIIRDTFMVPVTITVTARVMVMVTVKAAVMVTVVLTFMVRRTAMLVSQLEGGSPPPHQVLDSTVR